MRINKLNNQKIISIRRNIFKFIQAGLISSFLSGKKKENPIDGHQVQQRWADSRADLCVHSEDGLKSLRERLLISAGLMCLTKSVWVSLIA